MILFFNFLIDISTWNSYQLFHKISSIKNVKKIFPKNSSFSLTARYKCQEEIEKWYYQNTMSGSTYILCDINFSDVTWRFIIKMILWKGFSWIYSKDFEKIPFHIILFNLKRHMFLLISITFPRFYLIYDWLPLWLTKYTLLYTNPIFLKKALRTFNIQQWLKGSANN